MELRRLHLSLIAAQLVGVATLLRSVAYGRWITVLASALLIVGATAARRGRAWGVGLALGAAAAFPVAWGIGIAPVWFCLVGLVGALPFVIASRAFARFDKGATTLLAVLAASTGAFGAIAWKEYAWSIFQTFPLSRPSLEAQHGLALAALTALAVTVAITSKNARGGLDGGARVRVGERLRVSDAEERSNLGDALLESEGHDGGDALEEASSPRRQSRS